MAAKPCEIVKATFYEGEVSGLTTSKLRQLLKDNNMAHEDNRETLCKRVRENKVLIEQIDNYAPEVIILISRTYKEKESIESSREEETSTWEGILSLWENGKALVYPENIEGRFLYETSISGPDKPYEEEFLRDKKLDKLKQNYESFRKYINDSRNKYVTSFKSLSGATLVIPMPMKGKDYTTIKDFIDNASNEQQVEFWKMAAKVIREEWKKGKEVYVSTHGLNVPYLHLRIEDIPKYYKTERFK